MLYHMSIEADDPRHVADVLAEIWNGVAAPFPLVEGAWIAFAKDDRNTCIEVYPRGTKQYLPVGDAPGTYGWGDTDRYHGVHMAIGSPLEVEQLLAIAEREGWTAKFIMRGEWFGVVELWMENCHMVEVLTPKMQRDYLASFTAPAWQDFLKVLDSSTESQPARVS